MRGHTQLAITLAGDTGFVRIWHVVHVNPYAACSSVHQIDAACVMDRRLRMDWRTQPTDSVFVIQQIQQVQPDRCSDQPDRQPDQFSPPGRFQRASGAAHGI